MALFARAPPLWLQDPHQKAEAPTCVLVNCASFLVVWYSGLGHHFPGWAQAVALALMVGFGLMLFVLRQRVCKRFGPRDHAFIHAFFGVPEAWLACYPLAVAVLVVALDAWGPARVLPPDPVRAFAGLFVCVYTITNWISNGAHILFYDWFSSSGMKIAERRGMGSRGFHLYGVFKQAWIPRLSTHAFGWLCLLMNWNFWLALQGWSPTAFHFLLGFPLVLLRKSMLFAETSAGLHAPVLLPAVCWYLGFSPQLWDNSGPALAWTQEGPGWPACFLKVHILSMYVM